MLPNPLELIKQRFPKAYSKWSEDDDRLLEQKYKAGVPTKELAVIFQRQSGAIRSRLRKLKLSTETSLFHAGSVDIQFVFEWETVLSSENAEYIFPSPITDFMKQRYKKPAIYRWIVVHADNEANTQMYIGETKRLCPDRLSGYIIPGPTQQTNLRLNKFFHECLILQRDFA